MVTYNFIPSLSVPLDGGPDLPLPNLGLLPRNPCHPGNGRLGSRPLRNAGAVAAESRHPGRQARIVTATNAGWRLSCHSGDRQEANWTDRWQKSRALLARAQGSLAGGVQQSFSGEVSIPLYFADGCGCRVRDVDGNEYIDYALAWGPNILGYRHPKMVEAMTRAAAGPHIYGCQHELEILVAEKIQAMVPCAERVAFTSSGSEAVQLHDAPGPRSHRPSADFEVRGPLPWLDRYGPVEPSSQAGRTGSAGSPHPVAESRGQIPQAGECLVVRPVE